MSLIMISIGAALLLGATVYFWSHIADLFQKRIIPWFRARLGDSVADGIATVISWVDNKATMTQRLLRDAWQAINRHWLAGETEIHKEAADRAVITKTNYMLKPEGGVVRTTTEETVAWHDLPDNVRDAMLRQNTTQAKVDDKEAFRTLVEQRAAEEGLTLELAE